MIIVGLTGSIGMGKSTTANMFRKQGIPVHDADQTVHELYKAEAVAPVEARFPGVAVDGAIDRERLSREVIGNAKAMRDLEAIVHPLVREKEISFVENARKAGTALVVLDIPLLFETNRQDRVDVIVVVTTTPEIQRKRVLARPGMTEEKFEAILAKQVPDADKRARADYIVDTSVGIEDAKAQVRKIIAVINQAAAS